MHELSLMDSVVAAVIDRGGGARVTTVRLEIGRLTAVVPDSLRFCFDVCARGTPLEGATLEIVMIAGRARCRRCETEREIESYADLCACGGTDLTLLAGEELRVKN